MSQPAAAGNGAATVPPASARSARSLQELLHGEAPAGDTRWRPDPPPGLGAADARITLKLAIHRWWAAQPRWTTAARACLDGVPGPEECPDLWAGCASDTVTGGLQVRLREALALCRPAEPDPVATAARDAKDDPRSKVFTGKMLRRQREYVVASATSRVRITRKRGVHYIDRARQLDIEELLSFDWRADPEGDMDGFRGVDGAAPRRFQPGNLAATRYLQGPGVTVLECAGRLGRGPVGFPIRMRWQASADHPGVRLRIEIDNQHEDHRLRACWRALKDPSGISHLCTPVWAYVAHGGACFGATTLVRAIGHLSMPDGSRLSTPDAQCLGVIGHDFLLGG